MSIRSIYSFQSTKRYRNTGKRWKNSLEACASLISVILLLKSLSRQCVTWKDVFYRESHRECLSFRSSALVVTLLKDHEWGVGALFSALLPHRLRTREWGASRYSILLSRTAVLACKSHLTEIQERRYSLSSHQNDYTNSVGKRMQGAGKGTKLERAQTKSLLKFGVFFPFQDV